MPAINTLYMARLLRMTGHLFMITTLTLMIQQLATASLNHGHFKIGFLPAMSDPSQSHLNDGSRYAGAISVALNALRNMSEYRGLNFTYVYRDTEFETKATLRAIVEMYNDGVDVLLGPENHCVISAELAASLSVPMIGFRCTTHLLSNKTLYPTFSRTVPSNIKVIKSIVALLKHYNWSCFSIVEEETDEWKEVGLTLRAAAEANSFKINTNYSFPAKYRLYKAEHQQVICEIVKKTMDKTRVHIFLGEHDGMVQFIRCLYAHSNIALHSVIHTRSFDSHFDFDSENALKSLTSFWHEGFEPFDLNPQTLAFRQLITLQYRASTDNDLYQRFVSDVQYALGQPPFFIQAPPSVDIPISRYAAKVYDAVMLYAKSVKALIKLGGDPRNAQELTQMVINTSYTSIQQFTDTIDANGDAEGAYSTVAMVKDETAPSGWSVYQTGKFDKNGDSFISLTYKPTEQMSWLSGKVPKDEPACGFEGCTSTLSEILVSSLMSGLLLLAILVGLWYWRRRVQQKKIDSLLWKLDKSDIEIISSRLDLDDYTDAEQDSSCEQSALLNRDDAEHDKGSRLKLRSLQKLTDRPWSFLDGEDEEPPELPFYCPVGYFKNMLVSLKCEWKSLELTKTAKKQLHELKELSHENINKFIGACIDPPHTFIVFNYCERGSLQNVLLANRELFLTTSVMQYSLINDLVKGLMFIHSSFLTCHGNLKSSKCLVDSRFVLRISGFGWHYFKKNNSLPEVQSTKDYHDRLWRAPELLRLDAAGRGDAGTWGSQKGDIYSFGIIVHEILCLQGPWGETRLSDREIVEGVTNGNLPLIRPNLSACKCDDYLKGCMAESWAEVPEVRPDVKTLRHKIKPLRLAVGSNIMESMLERIEMYTKNLEGQVEARTQQLHVEKRRTEKLLHRMLPRSVAEDLKKGKQVEASYHECVTICFSDIVGFTKLCSESDPYQIVRFLNDLYTRFDEIIDNYDVYKVETIGDAYMVVSGLPKPNGDNHAGEIASMALHLVRALTNFKIEHRPSDRLQLRLGIHSGPVAVGVVGFKMPRYCLFGDTVNTTSRMESHGLPLKVHCSQQCKAILDRLGGYHLKERGIIEMKGKGQVITYWLTGDDSFHRIQRLAASMQPDSPCNSTRSSFEDNLHLMPNGFQRLKAVQNQMAINDSPFKTHVSTPTSRRNIRRGSMPAYDLKLGLFELTKRRGSTPHNGRKGLMRSEGVVGGTSVLDTVDPLKAVRAGPDGCENEPEIDSRRPSKRETEQKRMTAGSPVAMTVMSGLTSGLTSCQQPT